MILVGYASKYGATRGIAERIAEILSESGHEAVARPVSDVPDATEYDAFVLGGAAYLGGWMKELLAFIERDRRILENRPVWLFSSGPLATDAVGEEAWAMKEAAEPKEFAQLREDLGPRGDRVFFGALNPGGLNHRDRIIRAMPSGRTMLPEGDFRDWVEIEAWARHISTELSGAADETSGRSEGLN